MVMTDPVADMLTRVRNALRIRRAMVTLPSSRMKVGIASVLKREGYIQDYSVDKGDVQDSLTIGLKYGPEGEMLINEIKRISKPGRRIYRGATDLPRVLNGLGIAVVSTPKGVLSDREARHQRVGGEVLCTVW